MYPDLSYFFHDLFGTQPDNWTSIFKTFGVLLVLAILSAAFWFRLELKRKADNGTFRAIVTSSKKSQYSPLLDALSNGVFGFILAWKLPYIFQNFSEFQLSAADVLFSSKGNILFGILGFLGFAAFRYWENTKKEPQAKESVTETFYPHDKIGDLTIIAAISGVIGAKVFAVIEDLPGLFSDPIGALLSGNGLAIYGGLIGGFLGVYLYLKRHKIPFLPTADAVAPALIFAYGVGRIGCHMSGDGDWGIVAKEQPSWWFLPDWLWSYTYPMNVNNDGGVSDYTQGLIAACDNACFTSTNASTIESLCETCCGVRYCHELVAGVYPTPIYEIVLSLMIFGILWALRKRLEFAPGLLFFVYLIFNGIERYFIEFIRVNMEYNFLGFNLTQAQIIAIGLMLIGVIGGYLCYKRNNVSPLSENIST